MDVDCFSEEGESLVEQKGELVCKKPFPSAPIQFWNDPDGKKYKKAYFEKYPDLWHHGDFIELKASGGLIIHGRSDATLNPGGVRIGTAEIYRVVDELEGIKESLAVGLQHQGVEKIILFVVLDAAESIMDKKLENTIKSAIKSKASPRHVPFAIFDIPEFPRTRSGKTVEIAVRRLLEGSEITNRHALSNPDSLIHFEKIREVLSTGNG